MDSVPSLKKPISSVPAELRAEAESARAFALEQQSPATRRAYRADWRAFSCWCEARNVAPLPATPEVVATFLAAQAEAGVRASTISRRVAAIRYAHRLAGHEPPTGSEIVRATLRGIRRRIGVAKKQKAPLTVERLLEVVQHAPDSFAGLRDRALLLLGFAGAFRRSELAALLVEDLEEVEGGLRVTVRRAKTDQESSGQVVPVLRGSRACPVAALKTWFSAAEIENGSVFRRVVKGGKVLAKPLTPHSIGAVVKRYAAKAGFDPTSFGGHSLRAGFLTSAAARGASILKLMDVSRHRSVDTLRGYVRRAEEFRDHAGAGLL